jgi:hypothetical protein
VIDAVFRADPAGGGAEDGQIGEGERNEGGVEIVDGGEGVERALGERAFGAGAGGRGGLAGEAGDEIHERLGQLLVVDRAVDTEGRTPGSGGFWRRPMSTAPTGKATEPPAGMRR